MSASPWLPHGGPGPDELPLFLLPPAGGSAALYRDPAWQRLSPGVRACPVELPGRGARLAEPPLDDMTALVRELDDACRPAAGAPWAVLGHSMGALAAVAWAAAAHRQGHGPSAVYVSAAAPPWRFPVAAELAACGDELLWERLASLGGVPAQVRRVPQAARLLTRVMRADVRAAACLVEGEPPAVGCPVLAMCGADDPAVESSLLGGWADVTDAGFAQLVMPGAHFYEGGVADLVPVVRGDLDRVLGTERAARSASPTLRKGRTHAH